MDTPPPKRPSFSWVRDWWKPHTSEIQIEHQSRADSIADALTRRFGSAGFLIAQVALLGAWILINLGLIPGVPVVDPPPFDYLALFAAVEAIFLSTIVLMSQNNEADVTSMRQKLDFEINVRSEEEITRILRIVDEMRAKMGITPTSDPELDAMKEKTDLKAIKEEVEEAESASG